MMASYENLRPMRQVYKNALVHRKFSQLVSPAWKLPAKPSFILWNNFLGHSNLTSSRATFHNLAEHTLNSNVSYCMNIGTWMTATDKESLYSINMDRNKVNYDEIRSPIEKILKKTKILNQNKGICAQASNNPKITGLDMKEFRYTNSPTQGPEEKVHKRSQLAKKVSIEVSIKVPEREQN